MGCLPMGLNDNKDNQALPRNVFVLIVLLTLAKGLYDYPLLPDRLASHFDVSGTPNGWMMKPAFFAVGIVAIVVSALAGFVVPRAIAATSDARIRVPHKEYWLAPERRAETFAFFKRYFAWYGCALLVTEVLAMEFAIAANSHAPIRLPAGPMLFVISAFVVFNLLWTVRIFRRFSKMPE
jgi:uncharacterized membrane protein